MRILLWKARFPSFPSWMVLQPCCNGSTLHLMYTQQNTKSIDYLNNSIFTVHHYFSIFVNKFDVNIKISLFINCGLEHWCRLKREFVFLRPKKLWKESLAIKLRANLKFFWLLGRSRRIGSPNDIFFTFHDNFPNLLGISRKHLNILAITLFIETIIALFLSISSKILTNFCCYSFHKNPIFF